MTVSPSLSSDLYPCAVNGCTDASSLCIAYCFTRHTLYVYERDFFAISYTSVCDHRAQLSLSSVFCSLYVTFICYDATISRINRNACFCAGVLADCAAADIAPYVMELLQVSTNQLTAPSMQNCFSSQICINALEWCAWHSSYIRSDCIQASLAPMHIYVYLGILTHTAYTRVKGLSTPKLTVASNLEPTRACRLTLSVYSFSLLHTYIYLLCSAAAGPNLQQSRQRHE